MISQNLQRRVGTDDTTVAPQKLAIGEHAADPLGGENRTGRARGQSARSCQTRHRPGSPPCPGASSLASETQRGLADLARHLRAVPRIDNGPRMNDGRPAGPPTRKMSMPSRKNGRSSG